MEVHGVDDHSNFEGIISDTNDKQINEPLMGNFFLLGLQELDVVIFFAIHLKYYVDIIYIYQESFSVVLGNSVFYIFTGNNNFFIVCLVIPSVGCSLNRELFVGIELFQVNLSGLLCKC
jgi:hypothetical protein